MFNIFKRKKRTVSQSKSNTNKLGKRNQNKEELPKVRVSANFRSAISFVDLFTRDDEVEEKITIIDFVMEIVKRDLKYDYLTDVIYRSGRVKRDLGILQFPMTAYDESGNEVIILEGNPNKLIDLTNDTVVVMPWSKKRFFNAITMLKTRKFEYDKQNHFSSYFPEIDLVIAFNGNHSIGAGVGYTKGQIYAREISITKLFEHVYSDGEYWFNYHTKERMQILGRDLTVNDYRIAILYELAKKKHQLNNQ